jgi:crotonobetainyl-CoA:carnitine CoA-transferase CaiB-like acyl-CoA transferase
VTEDGSVLRVVEYAQDSIAASFAGRLLGELGADVLKVEVAGHPDPLRARPPAVGGASVSFAYTAQHKRFTVVADLAALGRTLADADVLITGGVELPADLRARGTTIAISPFGASGPRRGWRAGPQGLFHVGGVGYVTPRSAQAGASGEVAPEAPGGYLVEYFCGMYVALGALAYGTAPGQRLVDLSAQDCLLPLTRREVGAWLTQGRVPSRRERLWQVGPSDFYPCADGWVYVSVIEDAQWQRLVELAGGPASPPELATARQRFDHPDLVEEIIGPWLRARGGAEIFALTGAHGIPAGPAFSPAELAADPALWATHALGRLPVGEAGDVTVPRPVPYGLEVAEPPRSPRGTAAPTGDGPLAGVRVIEFAHVWAGPLCGQFLADLGAQVIRVESRAYLDVHRRAGPYVGEVPDIDKSTVWRAQNRGKLGCTLNLKLTAGRELAQRLVAGADLVIENYRPGTMDRLGLGYPQLRAVQPNITMVSLSGYGQRGPRSQFPAYGPMMDAVAGLAWSTRGEDGRPHSVNGWFPDVAGALYGAVLAAASCRGLLRPGHVDVSELQALLSFLPEQLAVAGDPSASAEVRANHSFGGHSCLPLRCRGEDSWIAVEFDDVDADIAWAALAKASGELGVPVGSAAPDGVRAAVRHLDAVALCGRLQSAGVAAVPVLSARDLVTDDHLAARQSFLGAGSGDAAETMYAPVWLVDGQRAPAVVPAPELGRDNAVVFRDILGLDNDAIMHLVESGVIR